MILYPAIDLKNGQCVRLKKGDMDAATIYGSHPAAQAGSFQDQGLGWLHVVDLDRAFAGENINGTTIEAILQTTSNPVQLGGGLRSLAHIENWLEKGRARVIPGTVAVRDPKLACEVCRLFPEKIAADIDARGIKVAMKGWAETAHLDAVELARHSERADVAAITYTDIERDGILSSINWQATLELARQVSIPVIASGGLASFGDIERMTMPDAAILNGAITGRALYDGRIDTAMALAALQQAKEQQPLPMKTRIIPGLDVIDGCVVKGINFVDLIDAGDPVEAARAYDAAGTDELCFLDITASSDSRDTIFDVVAHTTEYCFMPVTVGGRVRTLNDIRKPLLAGTDKVSINTAAVRNPDFIVEAADKSGDQCIVVAIDAKKTSKEQESPRREIFTHGSRTPTGIDAIEFAQKIVAPGAGEILLISIDRDGTKAGYNIELTRIPADNVSVPVIASGDVGTLDHLVEGIRDGHATAVPAASIFHFGSYSIREAKQYMAKAGIAVRLDGCGEGR